MKPLIGITPLFDEEKNSPWMQPAYLDGILKAGGLPVIIPLTLEKSDLRRLASKLDGILFTGGQDLDPSLYGDAPLAVSTPTAPARDTLERNLLKEILPTGKPVLGICRGCQLLNSVLGGTLYQDIATQYDTPINHRPEPPYDIPCHNIQVDPDTLLHQIMGSDILPVNSIHHQAIRIPAPDLQVAAYSEDGLIESVYHPDHPFFLGVQWHPERMYESDPRQLLLFEAFVRASKTIA